MIIVDGHLDLSWNALQFSRDLLDPVHTIRTRESTLLERGRALGTVALPEMQQGRIALCLATLLARSTGQPTPHMDYATQVQSYGFASDQLAYYRAPGRKRHIRIITNTTDLNAHVAYWDAWEQEQARVTQPVDVPATSTPAIAPTRRWFLVNASSATSRFLQ